MPTYDCTFILNSQLEEAAMESHIKNAKDLIGRHGGTIISDNRLGMRRLAYEIEKMTQGYYVSLVFDGDGAVINELERQFRLDEACLRFLTCHYQEEKRRLTKAEKARAAEAAEAAENGPGVAPAPETAAAEAAPAPEETPSSDTADGADASNNSDKDE